MEIYIFTKLNNGDILLQKKIIDTTNFIIINKDNGDILLQKNIQFTDITELTNYNFTKSIISDCSIDNKKWNKLKYKSILCQIYKLINDGTKIIKNTNLNIKTIKKEDNGFYYLDNIGISVQGVDSNNCLLEIINQCVNNDIKICMKVILFTDITISIIF